MKKPPMTTRQALTIAVLVLDFEAETAIHHARRWADECRQAATVLRKVQQSPFLNRKSRHSSND